MTDLYITVQRFRYDDPNSKYEMFAEGACLQSSGADAMLRAKLPRVVLEHISGFAEDPPISSGLDDSGFHYEIGIRRLHAQHAQAGGLHLETWPDDDGFSWSVIEPKTNTQKAAGRASALSEAIAEAAAAAEVSPQTVEWQDIGPRIP